MLQAGEEIDIWVIEKPLGSGGMGSVYRCHNRSAKRILAAVKVLEGAVRSSPDAQARFIREAEILFQLDHPNIVKVRNVRTDMDPPYLEMEFVEGESLEHTFLKGGLPLAQVIDLMEQAAGALAYLHAKGIRHRDIKPANLLVDRHGTLKLVDFGLAMEADTTRITQSGMAFGTVSYAPPEWIAPETLDPELWDIYALGVVFHELLTGEMAFPTSGQGSARQQAMQVIVGKQKHPPLDPGDRFPTAVREIIQIATHPDATRRLSSARELWQRLRDLGDDGRHAGVTLSPTDLDFDAFAPEPSRPPLPDPRPTTWSSPDELESAQAPVPAAPSLRGPMIAFALGALGLFAAMGLLGVALAVLLSPETATPPVAARAVEVLVLGVPDELEVHVRIGDRTGVSVGPSTVIEAVPVGAAEVAWVIGRECPLLECPGSACPAWCASGTQPVDVMQGDGSQTVRLSLTPPASRAVVLSTSLGSFTTATLGGRAGMVVDGALRFDVPPGKHEMIATTGTCPPDATGCSDTGTCVPGCASTRRTLEIALGTDPYEAPLGLEIAAAKPAPGPAPGGTPSPTPTPDPRPDPAPSGSGKTTAPITFAKFSKFLEDNPDYQKGGKRAGSESIYLAGWSGTQPPAGQADAPVTNINALAAATYCKWSRRSLPHTGDAPRAPDPHMEFRIGEDGKFVVLTEDGSPIPENDPKKANSFATFRCTR
ncbi:MAG: serine/threonine-protein kinase [Myxococcota bacterium]